MKKRLSFAVHLISILVFSGLTSAQSTWIKIYDNRSWDAGFSIQQTTDGGFIISGATADEGRTSDCLLIKTSADGTEQWRRSFGGNGHENGNAVRQTADGGYIIAGMTGSTSNSRECMWLLKTDGSGNEAWSHTYDEKEEYDTAIAHDVVQTSDGGYLLAGSRVAEIDSVMCIKTDGSGTIQWVVKYGGNRGARGWAVQQTLDGGYVIAGSKKISGEANFDVWLVKLNTDGTMQWQKTYGGPSDDEGYAVEQTPDGGYIVAGRTQSFGMGHDDAWLIKTDAAGGMQWQRAFGTIDAEFGYSVTRTTDGGYVMTGSIIQSGRDVWLIKTDSEGHEQWNYVFDKLYANGGGQETGEQVIQTSDGGYGIVGHSLRWYNGENTDVLFIKTNSAGQIEYARNTAGHHLEEAETAARDIQADAQLVYIMGPNMTIFDGMSDTWYYVFKSPAQSSLLEIGFYLGQMIVAYEITCPNPGFLSTDLEILDDDWMDSDDAMAICEMRGGEQFRSGRDSCLANMFLFVNPEGSTEWQLEYVADPAVNWFDVDAELDYSPLCTWTPGESGSPVLFRSADAVSSLAAWFVDQDGAVWRTGNGGLSCEIVSGSIDTVYIVSVAGIDDRTAVAAGCDPVSGQNISILRTEDGGASWSAFYQSGMSCPYDVTMFSSARGIVFGEPVNDTWVFLETTDGGHSWTPMPGAPDRMNDERTYRNDITWQDSLDGWFGTSASWIYHTINGGGTWTAVTVSCLDQVRNVAAKEDTVIAASTTPGQMARSSNNGQTWEYITAPEPDSRIRGIVYHQGNFWVTTGSSLYRSKDAGDTWILEVTGLEELWYVSFAEDPDEIVGWVVGANGTIVSTGAVPTDVQTEHGFTAAGSMILSQNYPNPFNPVTTIRYRVPEACFVSLKVYDMAGREICTLVQDRCAPGEYIAEWRAGVHPSGVYICRFAAGSYTETRKLVLQK